MTELQEEEGDVNAPVYNLPYMSRLIFSLTTLGAWPYKELNMKNKLFRINGKYLFPIWFVCWLMQISYIRRNAGVLSFFELGHTYITFFMNCISLQRLLMTWTKAYRQTVTDFVRKIHLYHTRLQSDYATKVHERMDKFSWWLRFIVYNQAYIGVAFFNVIPLINNYRNGMFSDPKPANGTYEHAVYYDIPFYPVPYRTEFKWFLVVGIANVFLTYDCAFAFCMFDVLISVIVFHVWGHIKILKHNIKSIADIGEAKVKNTNLYNVIMLDGAELKRVANSLKECVIYHRMIREFMDLTSTAFGPMVALYFIFHQVSLCIFLLELSQLDYDSLIRYSILTFFLFQSMIQMSVVFEQLGSESETIKDYIYDLPWELMDSKNRKTLWIFLLNTQEPLSFKALGVIPIGVQTMAGVLKTSFSYFMFLKTVAAEKFS